MDEQLHPLDAWLRDNKRTRAWLADKLSSTEATISRIVRGRQWGSRELFEQIAVLTKGQVTVANFIEPPKHPRRRDEAAA